MKRVTLTAVTLALIGMACGCATMQTAKRFDGTVMEKGARPLATVAVENYGYYLFGVIPIIAGEPKHPNANTCRLFDDSVTVQNNLAMISQVVKTERGRKLTNMNTTEEWTGAFSLWILWRKTLFTSALVME
ncbi:MAG: hypothetical protein FWG50_03075 [Kiritimatiellaeota bacterium]|nr:hypothetical protein [Kiritimatiellota bacterium]